MQGDPSPGAARPLSRGERGKVGPLFFASLSRGERGKVGPFSFPFLLPFSLWKKGPPKWGTRGG